MATSVEVLGAALLLRGSLLGGPHSHTHSHTHAHTHSKSAVLSPALRLVCSDGSDPRAVWERARVLAEEAASECESDSEGDGKRSVSECESEGKGESAAGRQSFVVLRRCGERVEALREEVQQLAVELGSESRAFLRSSAQGRKTPRRSEQLQRERGAEVGAERERERGVDAVLARCRTESAEEEGGGGGLLRLAAALEAGLLLGELAHRGAEKARGARTSTEGLASQAQKWRDRRAAQLTHAGGESGRVW
jgi:hypothetical protein